MVLFGVCTKMSLLNPTNRFLILEYHAKTTTKISKLNKRLTRHNKKCENATATDDDFKNYLYIIQEIRQLSLVKDLLQNELCSGEL